MSGELSNMTGDGEVAGAAVGPTHGDFDARVVLAVGAGGALGTVARHEVVMIAGEAGGVDWSVLAVNVAGSFLLGLLATLILERWPPTRHVRPFAAIGFCGALTTFSTWMMDSVLLAKDISVAGAGLNLLAGLAIGLAAMYAGVVVARSTPRRKGVRS